MIANNYEPTNSTTYNIKIQYNSYFVGSTVNRKIQVSSYLNEITDNADNDNIASFDKKTINQEDMNIKIDIAFDKNTNQSYYKVSLYLIHKTDKTGKLEKDQHIQDDDVNTLITYYLSNKNDKTLLQEEINKFLQKEKAVSSCDCYNYLSLKAPCIANEIIADILNNNVKNIIAKYDTIPATDKNAKFQG